MYTIDKDAETLGFNVFALFHLEADNLIAFLQDEIRLGDAAAILNNLVLELFVILGKLGRNGVAAGSYFDAIVSECGILISIN